VTDPLLELDYQPLLPAKRDYGIAIVGCGGIVNYAHLPAYRKHNLNVVGCYDIRREHAEKTAQTYHIPRVYASLEELLADPEVAIVDIAVQPWHQAAIARQAIAAGKHLLCQKPLSDIFSEAVSIVQQAHAAGVKLAVNQQMRWDPGIRATAALIRKGWIGEPTDATIQVSVSTPWEMWPWLAKVPRLEVMYHSIHYIDSIRYLFGDPAWVTSRHARSPLQGGAVGETKTITVLDYSSGLQVLIAVNHYNQTDEQFAIFRFIGTAGVISGTIGLMYNYPHGRPDTLCWSSKRYYPDKRFEAKLEGLWIPDAFIGPMASLMRAIQEDGTPETDGADNLNTLRIVNAAYLSAAENRSVQPSEIT
jgi:predicted dehydrogenase